MKLQTLVRPTKSFFLLTLFTVLFFTSIDKVKSQNSSEKQEYIVSVIGFYNVENLFDTINDPKINDVEFTPEGSNKWNSKKYFEKLDNLSQVIEQLGVQEYTPDGVAVLGLSEVENRRVLEDLAKTERLKSRNYQIVHYDGPDGRGVDVAFFYNPKYFKYISSKPHKTVVEGFDDFRTRDQLLLTGEMLGERVHFIVAHWPSRVGGEKSSRPRRIAAANIARSIIDSIQAAEPNAKIFMMGDLNDNPDDISVRKHLRSNGNINKVKDNELFNPFYELYKKGIGSNAYRDTWSLFDQILLSPGLIKGEHETFQYWKREIFNKPFLVQPSGRFQGYPYRSFAGGAYLGGYSDHFPTLVYLLRKK